MSNALKYQDLSHTERLEYERIVGQGLSSEKSAPCDADTPHGKRQPARRRPFLAAATSLGSSVTRLFQRGGCLFCNDSELSKNQRIATYRA
jgi:hypothetical protein